MQLLGMLGILQVIQLLPILWIIQIIPWIIFIQPCLASPRERIIGGSVVSGDERPPVMGIFNFQPSSSVKCSCSVISAKWAVSAAHCIVEKEHFINGSCMEEATMVKFLTVCEQLPNGDTKLIFPTQKEQTPRIYIGVDDLTTELRDRSKKFLVDYIISPKDGYQGGKYGSFGGYDIILVKTHLPMDLNAPINVCIPGPDYTFSNPNLMIGGYGRNRRIPCEVNDLGPSIFQFCKVDNMCKLKTQQYQQAKCNVQFTYNNKEYGGCITEEETPSARNPICSDFRSKTLLTDQKMRRIDPGKYGWCGITNNVIDGKFEKTEDGGIETDNGWGICSQSCDTANGTISGKPKVKKAQILDQDYCDNNLNMLRGKLTDPYTVNPKVYCVAYNETYKTAFFLKSDNGSYVMLDNKPEYHSMLGRKNSWYIRSVGSCLGDSGGPLYEKVGIAYVLLGITSRGIGKLANCGGIENPTHYVRMKDMLVWISNYIPKDDLCVINSN
ncbi:uncharacterized protein LOC111695732 isoform X2 [Eurytemora carolleeae]|uniref:uncharacterized protein LOC111695732 isoform X2 n=1 Tax=Eurytemora carolleeae TaxID=1294199 RepID=UPI000C7758CB|nr:uncharacterized protein LOC111695732 isoform X2 [Eurytemora carolleeae]|eukprot:XP_023320927.1 uncharacterized protein LOC111695732 isoform X2 [Eurytemora affinis]